MLIERVRLHAAYGALMIMDSHFSRPISTAVLSFNGKTLPYHIKPDGYYVLTQPATAGETCLVECPGYAPLEITVEHDANGRFFALASLNHLAGHTQMAYIRKMLASLRQNGKPLPETSFTLALGGRIPALMLIEDAEIGATALRLNTERETRLIGQSLLLPGQSVMRNMITGIEESDSYKLARPLDAELKQGQQLSPVWELATDYKGEFIFPYKPYLLREPETEIIITYNGNSQTCTALFPTDADNYLTIDFS